MTSCAERERGSLELFAETLRSCDIRPYHGQRRMDDGITGSMESICSQWQGGGLFKLSQRRIQQDIRT